jgi:hypothetical protein
MGGLVPLSLVLLGTGIVWLWVGPDHASVFAVVSMILGSLVGFVDDLRSQQRPALRRLLSPPNHRRPVFGFLAPPLFGQASPQNTFALF